MADGARESSAERTTKSTPTVRGHAGFVDRTSAGARKSADAEYTATKCGWGTPTAVRLVLLANAFTVSGEARSGQESTVRAAHLHQRANGWEADSAPRSDRRCQPAAPKVQRREWIEVGFEPPSLALLDEDKGWLRERGRTNHRRRGADERD